MPTTVKQRGWRAGMHTEHETLQRQKHVHLIETEAGHHGGRKRDNIGKKIQRTHTQLIPIFFAKTTHESSGCRSTNFVTRL